VTPLKAYLVTTGILFVVITAAHILEIVDRSRLFASDVVIVAISAGLSVWAFQLARKSWAASH